MYFFRYSRFLFVWQMRRLTSPTNCHPKKFLKLPMHNLLQWFSWIKKLKILFCFTGTGTAALPNFRKLNCGWPDCVLIRLQISTAGWPTLTKLL